MTEKEKKNFFQARESVVPIVGTDSERFNPDKWSKVTNNECDWSILSVLSKQHSYFF